MRLITRLSRLLFWETSAEKLATEMLHEAESLALQHQLSARHHQALADMYSERVAWLRTHPASQPKTAISNA